MASLETCHFPHEARVVVVVDVAVVDVAVVVIIVTSMSTLLQSLPKDPMQHSSPDLYHPEQSGVGPVIPIPLFVQVSGVTFDKCHFPHNPELCVTIPPPLKVVVVAATVVVVVVTGCSVGICEGKEVG